MNKKFIIETLLNNIIDEKYGSDRLILDLRATGDSSENKKILCNIVENWRKEEEERNNLRGPYLFEIDRQGFLDEFNKNIIQL